jgi:hypothetical protein
MPDELRLNTLSGEEITAIRFPIKAWTRAYSSEAVDLAQRASKLSGWDTIGESKMSSSKQKKAARKNISKAATAAKKKRTIAHLPKSVRTALGKKGAAAARKKRKAA